MLESHAYTVWFFHLWCFCGSHLEYDMRCTSPLPLLCQQHLWINTAQLWWLHGSGSWLWGPGNAVVVPAVCTGMLVCARSGVIPTLFFPSREGSCCSGSLGRWAPQLWGGNQMIRQPMLPEKLYPSSFKEEAPCQPWLPAELCRWWRKCKNIMRANVTICGWMTCQPGSWLWWKGECFVLAVIVSPE